MLSKLMLALIGLALCVPAADAAEHPEGPHHPALMIPLPGEFMHPPPPEDEEARKKWFEKAFGALDADGDGGISKGRLTVEHSVISSPPQGMPGHRPDEDWLSPPAGRRLCTPP